MKLPQPHAPGACSSYVRPWSTGCPTWHRYLEIKTVSVQLLSRYTFGLAKGHETCTYTRSITLAVKGGMIMDITPVLED